MGSYVFTLRRGSFHDPHINIDSWLDVTKLVGMDKLVFNALCEHGCEFDGVFSAIESIRMRKRMNPDIEGPLLVHFDGELSADDLFTYVNTMSPEELKTFTKKARLL